VEGEEVPTPTLQQLPPTFFMHYDGGDDALEKER